MREILFRGKICEMCKYQGQWLEGFYAVENGKPFIAIPKENGLNGFYCDPETVGQFTGLTDKNGTKIFEGDVLKIPFGKEFFKAVVKFGYYNQFDFVDSESYRKDVGFRGKTFSKIEVIGNIHDNPELMGGNTNG